MRNIFSKLWEFISRIYTNWAEEYETHKKEQQEQQQRFIAEQQRLARLQPAMISLDGMQQLSISDCMCRYQTLPAPLPPLALTTAQSIDVTNHMLTQLVALADHVEVQGVLALMMQDGIQNLNSMWSNLHQELFETVILPFSSHLYHKALVQPMIELRATSTGFCYDFLYNIGPYSGAVFTDIQDYCRTGLQTQPLKDLFQRYGLQGINILYRKDKALCVIRVW